MRMRRIAVLHCLLLLFLPRLAGAGVVIRGEVNDLRSNGQFNQEILIDGYPVRVRRFKDGPVVQDVRFLKPEPRDLPASLFEVPDGYNRLDLRAPQGRFRGSAYGSVTLAVRTEAAPDYPATPTG